jgi:hypothetical protein
MTPSQSKIKTSTSSKSCDCGSESFKTLAMANGDDVKARRGVAEERTEGTRRVAKLEARVAKELKSKAVAEDANFMVMVVGIWMS